MRRDLVLDRLADRLAGVRQLVLLGDVLELRGGPVRDALAASRPALERLGAALGDRPVVLVPGNHDHALIAPWLERRTDPLGLAERVEPRAASDAAAQLAAFLRPARLELAYPGVWLRDDVYATHGHYLDCHITVPTAERLAIGVMGRLSGPGGAVAMATAAVPDDYERLVAPIYAWIHAVAQTGRAGNTLNGGVSGRAWRTLRGRSGRPLRARALAAAVPLAIAGINRAGLGPVRAELTGTALRRAGLRAMTDVVERLGVDASHVLFGHTHRPGPLPDDDATEWVGRGGVRLHNTGSWILDETFGSPRAPGNPYAPGLVAIVDSEGPPRLERLLHPDTDL